MTEGATTHVYEYDSLDRLIRAYQKDSNGNIIVAVENTYDELGRAKGSSYTVGSKEMLYGLVYKTDSNLVDYISMPTAGTQSMIRYYYDEFDRVIEKFIAHSTTMNYSEEYEYYTYTGADGERHTTSLVSQITFSSNSGTADVVYDYTYDNLGNITAVYKNGVLAESYEYDSLGQLIREDNVAEDYTVLYVYDKAGNIASKEQFVYSTAPTWHMEALAGTGALTSYTYGNSSWGDLLTNFNGTAISYDAIGNPTNWRNSSSMSWNARELASQTLSDGTTLNYTYNSSGIRTRKVYNDSVNSTSYIHNYLLDGTKILKETVTITTIGGGTTYDLHYVYDESGNVVGLHYNNKPYYFQKNLQGDVIRILDYSGNAVVEYTYDAWGKVLSVSGSMANTLGQRNPFRYRSYYYDTETGFYYLQSRYYDPVVGRFLNADGIIGANGGIEGYNMFAYCNNNPVVFEDNSGRLRTYCVMDTGIGSTRLRSTQTENSEKTPDFAEDWTSPVRRDNYHNDAPCAAFGYYRSKGKTHKGVDYYPYDSGNLKYGGDGTPQYVYAMYSGVVVDITQNFYNYSGSVKIIQDDGYYVIYGEIEAIGVVVGQKVEKGQLIGIMERSTSNTLMLHLQIHKGTNDGELIDPTFTYYLPDYTLRKNKSHNNNNLLAIERKLV